MSSRFNDVQKYAKVLEADAELLDLSENPEKGVTNQNAKILRWCDIPDVAGLTSTPVVWAAEGLIPAGAITLLAGEPGSFKSWLALILARGVSTGGNFLGRICGVRDVLILDRENPLAVVQERLLLLGIEGSPTLKIWGGWCHDAPPGIGDFRLKEIARERTPLMVFDSLLRFHSAEENSASEMGEVMGELRLLANAGAAVLLLHHKPKAEGTRYRGSSDIAGGVDVAYSVFRDREAGMLRLECFKSRYREEFTLTLRPEIAERGDITVTDAPELSQEMKDSDVLREAIEAEPGLSQGELVKRSRLPDRRARTLLHRGIGTHWRTEDGARNALRYFPLTRELEVVI